MQALQQKNQERSVQLPGVDLRDIPFSPVEHFGYAHSQEMATLAHYIGDGLKLDAADLKAVKVAGLLHDVGRTLPWQQSDLGHQTRGADIAVRFLKSQPEVYTDTKLISDVGWLIANHCLSGPLPTDARLQALWDADAYDAARLAVGTPEGLRVFKARTDDSRLCTDWAKDKNNKKTWLAHRGWR